MKKTYTIRLQSEFVEPYSIDDDICQKRTTDEYQTESHELCQKIVRDLMDAPEAQLSLEQIRKDFEDPRFGKLEECKLVAIQNYYNGRLAILNRLSSEIEISKDSVENQTFHYDIPEDYNSFCVYSDEDPKVKQNSAYIEVISKVEA